MKKRTLWKSVHGNKGKPLLTHGKKGISPIIATVLLIAFTVALAALVMNWQGKFVTQVQEQTSTGFSGEISCMSDVDISVSVNEAGNLIVENNKGAEIAGIIVREYMDDGSITVRKDDPTKTDDDELNEVIQAYGSKTYSTFIISGNKVEVIPMIKIESGNLKNCDAQSDTYTILTNLFPL